MKHLQKLVVLALSVLPLANAHAEKFVQNGTEYILNPELRAQLLKRGADVSGKFQSANVFYKTNHFVIFKQSVGELSANTYAVQKNQDEVTYPVVYDTRTKQYGIMRGHFVVKMKGKTHFSDARFQVANEYPDFGSYVVDIPAVQSIQSSLDQLKQNKDVERVSIEISEVFREAM